VERGKENFLIAAELGSVEATIDLGCLVEKTDLQRFVWLEKAAVNGGGWSFLSEIEEQNRNFNSGCGNANVIFAIGRALKGHIDNEKRKIFGDSYSFGAHIGPGASSSTFNCNLIEKQSMRGRLLGLETSLSETSAF
jgi:hypothetical protein